MTSTLLLNSPPDGRRAGATWVAATGAFLLLASAAVFIAVRWDRLPEMGKVALVAALTGAFLVGGQVLRRWLPATGDVLFHLGALLIPIDVAALCLLRDVDWPGLLLAEGLVGTAVLGALALATGSVVLGTAAGTFVVVLAAGIAAFTPVPAPLALAGAATAAHVLRRHRLAITWAGMAGLAPVLGAIVTGGLGESATRTGRGVIEALGLGGAVATGAALAVGALTAVILGREAARRKDLGLVALAGTCLVSGAATSWVHTQPSRNANFLAAGGLFLLIEVTALLCQRDAFWRRPAQVAAFTAEAIGVLATPVAGVILLLAPVIEDGFGFFGEGSPWRPEPAAAVAWTFAATGWLLAGWRRTQAQTESKGDDFGRRSLTTLRAAVSENETVLFLAAAVGAAVVVGTASSMATGVVLVGIAAGLAAVRGVVATLVAVAAAMWAPVVVSLNHPGAILPLGAASIAVLGAAAWNRGGEARGWSATGLASAASVVAVGLAAYAQNEWDFDPAILGAVAAAWGLALLVERTSAMASHVVRATMLLGVVGAFLADTSEILWLPGHGFTWTLPVTGLAAVLFAVDAIRHDEPLIALGAAVGAPVVVATAAVAAGLELPDTGLALCASAVVACALAVPYAPRWRLPFVSSAALALTSGLVLTAADPTHFAGALIVAGSLVIALALALRSWTLGHAGGALVVTGTVLGLFVIGVTASEAFAAPVALQLLVAGWQAQRWEQGPSSWVAYGPAISLMGGAAFAERLAGAPAWHGLIAGSVGVAAVAVGGWRRLAGPLFLGTGLVVAVTVLESLSTLAGVPTWAWLAAGGLSLLTTGVALERAATSPLEVGRRLVDVVSERFA